MRELQPLLELQQPPAVLALDLHVLGAQLVDVLQGDRQPVLVVQLFGLPACWLLMGNTRACTLAHKHTQKNDRGKEKTDEWWHRSGSPGPAGH